MNWYKTCATSLILTTYQEEVVHLGTKHKDTSKLYMHKLYISCTCKHDVSQKAPDPDRFVDSDRISNGMQYLCKG